MAFYTDLEANWERKPITPSSTVYTDRNKLRVPNSISPQVYIRYTYSIK